MNNEYIKIICVTNNANITNGFTDGRSYKATLFGDSKKLYKVKNDNGDTRYVLLNEPSPHLVHYGEINKWPFYIHEPVGFFRKDFSE